MFRQRTPHFKDSPKTDIPSPSLLLGIYSRRKKFIKVEVIESTQALPKKERLRSNCMTEVVLKMCV
jgi:hypothetical protein